MKVLTYFCFTLLSIFIQFSVMDYIKDKLLIDEENYLDLNLTSPKTQLSDDILKDFSSKPHALYYHSAQNDAIETNDENTLSVDNKQLSTDATSTISDDNSFTMESISTTDSEHKTTEFDNATEVTFLVNNNRINQSGENHSFKVNFKCKCNLLHEICDIHCCCDADCDDSHKNMFNCNDSSKQSTNDQNRDICISNILHSGKSYNGNFFDNMFCIVKTNLPEKRNVETKFRKITAYDQYLTWQCGEKSSRGVGEYSKTLYKIGDPVWLLRNTTIFHLDFPNSMVNDYCTGRKPIKFLKDEVINCKVKYRDLEFFRILKMAEDSKIISAIDVTANSTDLNCSTVHCTNLTIIVCNGEFCVPYNKKIHKSLCNKTICTNIALTIDYIIYYYDSKIANVSVTLHMRNISLTLMSQKISVKFLLRNKTDDQIVEFSGSPGYKKGRMIIVSFNEGNYTDNFYQNKIRKEKYLSVPINENGRCVSPKFNNFVQFGFNKRTKCRYHNPGSHYDVNVCKHIQNNISELYHLNEPIVISPYGNPYNVDDKDWIRLNLNNLVNESVYREIDNSFHCYNVISKVSFTFTFISFDDKENNTISSLNITISTRNISFSNLRDISIVLTTDINFVNLTEPTTFEYAGPPHMNIYVPKTFFFPYA